MVAQLSLLDDAPPAYDRRPIGAGPLDAGERAALAHHGYALTELEPGVYAVAGAIDGWPVMGADALREDIDLFYLAARAGLPPWRAP